MIRASSRLGLFLFLLCFSTASADAPEATPAQVVRQYLEAMEEGDFETAWDLSSEGMRGGKSREAWAAERRYIFQISETKIFGYEITKSEIEGDEAYVANVLSSQDKFLNQLGVEEHELYTLVKEDGAWRVDQQAIVIDREGLEKWFPDEVE